MPAKQSPDWATDGVEGVAQAVSEQVEPEQGERERGTGHEHLQWLTFEIWLGIEEHSPPLSSGGLLPQSEKREARQ